MNKTEELLEQAKAHKTIRAYAVNGFQIELNVNGTIIKTTERGLREVMQQLDPGLFSAPVEEAVEEAPVVKPRRKRNTEQNR